MANKKDFIHENNITAKKARKARFVNGLENAYCNAEEFYIKTKNSVMSKLKKAADFSEIAFTKTINKLDNYKSKINEKITEKELLKSYLEDCENYFKLASNFDDEPQIIHSMKKDGYEQTIIHPYNNAPFIKTIVIDDEPKGNYARSQVAVYEIIQKDFLSKYYYSQIRVEKNFVPTKTGDNEIYIDISTTNIDLKTNEITTSSTPHKSSKPIEIEVLFNKIEQEIENSKEKNN